MTCGRCRRFADTKQCRECKTFVCWKHYSMTTHEPILDTVLCVACEPEPASIGETLANRPMSADERARLMDDLETVLDRQIENIRHTLDRFHSRVPRLTKAQREEQRQIRDRNDLIKYGQVESRGITRHANTEKH